MHSVGTKIANIEAKAEENGRVTKFDNLRIPAGVSLLQRFNLSQWGSPVPQDFIQGGTVNLKKFLILPRSISAYVRQRR